METSLTDKNNHEFFFTASFLVKFFEKYQNDMLEGNNSRSQDLFKDFIMNGKGKIFMDRPDINLNNYPHLIQLMSGDSQGNYTPFDYPKDIVEHKTFTKEENIETMGVMGSLVSFSNTFNSQNLTMLARKHCKKIFTSVNVESKWTNYCENSIDDLEEDLTTSWGEILSSIDLPTSSIILCDQYLMQSESRIKSNLIPILDHFSKICDMKIPFIILSKHVPRGYDIPTWKKKWEKRLNTKYANSLKISLHFVEGTIGKVHDRRLLTDYRLLNFPSGFDLLNEKRKVTKNTEPSIRTLLSGKSAHEKTYYIVKNFLEKQTERTSNHYNKLYSS